MAGGSTVGEGVRLSEGQVVAGHSTVGERLRRDVAPLGWIIGNLLLWAVMVLGNETTFPMWVLVAIPIVPVAIGHICQYALAGKHS
jgi:hypothetical protein